MVQKVKRFLVFILFSFFYSLLSGKVASAETRGNKFCIVPKSGNNLIYNKKVDTSILASSVGSAFCYN